MCRILGISYGDQREELDTGEIMAILFAALVRQGPHAYGWMSYNPDSESVSSVATSFSDQIEYAKFPGRSDSEDAWENILENVDPNAKWFVGHTRWATHGDPKDIRNDHPIPHGEIIGVHNGTVSNYKQILQVTGREDEKTLVDSEAIFAAVNRWGPTKGLSKVNANMVALYANRNKPHVLHLARSSGRQITIGWTTKGNLVFASDRFALDKLQPEIQFRKFSTVSENRLLLIRDGKIIQRFNFGPVKPKYQAPPAVVTIKSHERTSAEIHKPKASPPMRIPADAPGIDYFERVAQRRGSKLFPNGAPQTRHAQRGAANQNRKLYYHDGVLMSYEDHIVWLSENER